MHERGTKTWVGEANSGVGVAIAAFVCMCERSKFLSVKSGICWASRKCMCARLCVHARVKLGFLLSLGNQGPETRVPSLGSG